MAELVTQGGVEALRAGVQDAWLNQLAITGTHAEALEAFQRYEATGANAVILVPPEDADWDAWLDNPFMELVTARN
jgi:hypothetical protein